MSPLQLLLHALVSDDNPLREAVLTFLKVANLPFIVLIGAGAVFLALQAVPRGHGFSAPASKQVFLPVAIGCSLCRLETAAC